MKMYAHKVNLEIAYTHVISRKKQTLITALGITIGIAIFIFMNSLMKGFDRSAEESLFKTMPHLRVFHEDELSAPLLPGKNRHHLNLISNPKISDKSKRVINPQQIIKVLSRHPDVVAVAPEVSVNVFYNNGKAQVSGVASGVNISFEDAMFGMQSKIMVDGHINHLAANSNGIILGSGIAEKLSVRVGDTIAVTSSEGAGKTMRVVGLFTTSMSATDNSRSYVNLHAAQQLLKESQSFITDIKVNIKDADAAYKYMPVFSSLSGYKTEDWATANASARAAGDIRKIMALTISLSILLVAGFGIYNILYMAVMQKMNDIAILKAMEFSGRDVIRVFAFQSVFIAIMGVIGGLMAGTFLITRLSKVWIGGDMGFFPVQFEPVFYILGVSFGTIITLLAGYIPAKKAANVDPVSILRR